MSLLMLQSPSLVDMGEDEPVAKTRAFLRSAVLQSVAVIFF